MDVVRLSRYPHLAWTQFFLRVPSGGRRISLHMRGTMCGVSIALNGHRLASQVTHGQELSWTESSGMVSCVPADGEQHTYPMTSDSGCELFVTLVPPSHLTTVATAEGVTAFQEWKPILGSDDAVIGGCMARLAASRLNRETEEKADDVARRLILRILELNGGGKPDWHDDASVFDRRTLLNLVAYVDEHLRCKIPKERQADVGVGSALAIPRRN